MFKAKSVDGLKLWNQSETLNILNTVDSTVAKLLGYLPATAEADAYRHGVEDALDSVAGMFGLRRED